MLMMTDSQPPAGTDEYDHMNQWYGSRVANLRVLNDSNLQQFIHFEVSTEA